MGHALASGIPAASHHNQEQKEAEIKEVEDEVEGMNEVGDPWPDPSNLHVNACRQFHHDNISSCYSNEPCNPKPRCT